VNKDKHVTDIEICGTVIAISTHTICHFSAILFDGK